MMIDMILLVFGCMFLAGATCWVAGYYAGLSDSGEKSKENKSDN